MKVEKGDTLGEYMCTIIGPILCCVHSTKIDRLMFTLVAWYMYKDGSDILFPRARVESSGKPGIFQRVTRHGLPQTPREPVATVQESQA